MRLVPPAEFLIWAALRGIILDERYQPPRCLVYRDNVGDSRFWVSPKQPKLIRRFVERVLDGLGTWHECGLWRRGGDWPEYGRVGEWLEKFSFVNGTHCGGIILGHGERLSLVRLIMRQVFVGGNVDDDLFVIPDNGRAFLYVDHHGVVHGSFAAQSTMESFVGHMSAGGYELPLHPPDETFKPVKWMR